MVIKMKTVYYIRHAEPLKDNKLVNVSESSQIQNEKLVLSLAGEKQAEKLSKIEMLQHVDEVWSSNYVRAICTAKYIAKANQTIININENLGERKLGDLNILKQLWKDKDINFTTAQLLDENLKNRDGESQKEARIRMKEITMEIVENTKCSNIAIVSHGAAIKFLLMNWCKLDENLNIIYKNKIIVNKNIDYTDAFKLQFENNELINIEKIKNIENI